MLPVVRILIAIGFTLADTLLGIETMPSGFSADRSFSFTLADTLLGIETY